MNYFPGYAIAGAEIPLFVSLSKGEILAVFLDAGLGSCPRQASPA
jgi:hypothetical protein